MTSAPTFSPGDRVRYRFERLPYWVDPRRPRPKPGPMFPTGTVEDTNHPDSRVLVRWDHIERPYWHPVHYLTPDPADTDTDPRCGVCGAQINFVPHIVGEGGVFYCPSHGLVAVWKPPTGPEWIRDEFNPNPDPDVEPERERLVLVRIDGGSSDPAVWDAPLDEVVDELSKRLEDPRTVAPSYTVTEVEVLRRRRLTRGVRVEDVT